MEHGGLKGPRKGSFPLGAALELRFSLSDPQQPSETSWGDASSHQREGDLGSGVCRTGFSGWEAPSCRSLHIHPPNLEGPLASPSPSPGQVEPTPWGRGRVQWGGEEAVCGTESSTRGCVDPPEEGGNTEGPPAPLLSGICAEGAEPAERDLGRPSKHRARHARLRRSESQSEKQVKETKSKCKCISLLLTAAPNSTNKGVLMFKRHRERAKRYTLVSYGTGESEPEDGEEAGVGAVELTFPATCEPELVQDFFLADAQGGSHGTTVTLDRDARPLETGEKLDHKGGMERLPETKGKGALMFAKRRQRIDEITAQHEEMRSKGIPVEGAQQYDNAEVTMSYQKEDVRSYMQSPDGYTNQVKVDMNVQHQQQPYQQQQQQIQQYPHHVNGIAHQSSDTQRSHAANRTAQPFLGVQNRVPAPFSSSRSANTPVSEQPGYSGNKFRVVPPPVPVNTRPQVLSPTDREQMVSRDERIAVPAIKTGILQDAKKRSPAKESLKVSPTSQLLNHPNKGDKRTGFESVPEEDYLSLGAEACNFLHTATVKHKTPPPVAPKPNINLASPPWSTENPTQLPFHAVQNDLPTPVPGAAPTRSLQQQTPGSAWAPAQTQSQTQSPVPTWGPSQYPAHLQQPADPWAPQPHPARPVNSYTSRIPPAGHVGSASSARGASPASDMPAMSGKGAELFARRQSRMEKFVVDSETVQANKARSQSPTPSLPNFWKYSPNVRAPPPTAYNPILSPAYPPGVPKQPVPSSSAPKAQNKAKGKPGHKPLNVLDVMKHQPYQLDASLFTYGPAKEAKAPSPKPALGPGPAPTPANNPIRYEPGAPLKPTGPVSVPYPFVRQQEPPPESHPSPLLLPPSPAAHGGPHRPTPASSHQPTSAQSVPGGVRHAAPRPKFSAKKPAVTTKSWKTLVVGQ